MPRNEMPEGFRPGDPTAPPRAETHHTSVSFSLKDGDDVRENRIMIEEDAPGLPLLGYDHQFLMLGIRKGVPYEDAQALVRQLNHMVEYISHTKFSA